MDFSLSTRLFYDRSASAMGGLTTDANRLYEQLSTGKRVLTPADDGAAWQKRQALARAGADAKVDSANVRLAQGILGQADTALAAIGDQLKGAADLVVQAGNGTLTPTAKATIAAQLDGILSSVVALANGNDLRGQPLFGGAGGEAAVTLADGRLRFAEGSAGAIPLGDGQQVQASVGAGSFPQAGDEDLASVLTGMIAALNAGEALPEGSSDALAAIADRTTAAQASLGARAARVDLVAAHQTVAAIDREIARSALENVDVTAAITELQQTLTVLQATQASFSKLSGLSLFDYLR